MIRSAWRIWVAQRGLTEIGAGRAEPHRRDYLKNTCDIACRRMAFDRRGGRDRPTGADIKPLVITCTEAKANRIVHVSSPGDSGFVSSIIKPGARVALCFIPPLFSPPRVPERRSTLDHVERVHGLGSCRSVLRGKRLSGRASSPLRNPPITTFSRPEFLRDCGQTVTSVPPPWSGVSPTHTPLSRVVSGSAGSGADLPADSVAPGIPCVRGKWTSPGVDGAGLSRGLPPSTQTASLAFGRSLRRRG